MKKLMIMVLMIFTLIGCKQTSSYQVTNLSFVIEAGEITDEVRTKQVEVYINDQLVDSKLYMGLEYLHEHSMYEYGRNKEVLTHESNGQTYVTTKKYVLGKLETEVMEKNGHVERHLLYKYDGDDTLVYKMPEHTLVQRMEKLASGETKKEDFTYDDEGFVIQTMENDLLVKEIFYNEMKEAIFQKNYEYDEYGFMILDQSYDPILKQPLFTQRAEVVYNEEKRPISIAIYHEDVLFSFSKLQYEDLQ